MRWFVVVAAAAALSGCMTQFYGRPKVPNGAAGCRAQCTAQGLEFAGMVFMGEYSDGCICQEKGKVVGAREAAQAAGPAVAGVIMQQNQQQQQQQSHTYSMR